MGAMVVAPQTKTFQIPPAKIPPNKPHPPQIPSPPTVRTPWKVVSAPFKHAELNGNLHLFARLMVVEL
jgi:hypothetical protein